MINISRIFMAFTLAVISFSGRLYAQEDSSRQAIVSLINRFTNDATKQRPLAEFFSPTVRNTQPEDVKTLSSKSFRRFVIYNFSPSDIEFKDPNHASVRATVEWETSNESVSKLTTVDFVNVEGSWYFADSGFWKLSLLWITPFVAYGIAYGVGVTIMLIHIRKVPWFNARARLLWEFLSLVPGTLPLYFARRPWLAPAKNSGTQAPISTFGN